MNGFKNDIDGKTAFAWKKQNNKLRSVSNSRYVKTKKQLYNVIFKYIQQFTQKAYGKANDQKYSRIVDLIMLRIKSDLDNVIFTSIEADNVKTLVKNALQNAYDEHNEEIKYSDLAKSISYDLAQYSKNKENENNLDEKTKNETEAALSKNASDHVSSAKDVKSSAYSSIVDKVVNKTTDIIIQMMSSIDDSFKRLESAIMQHFNIVSPQTCEENVINTIDTLKGLQLSSIDVNLKNINVNLKYDDAKDKQKGKKAKEAEITLAGMKFSTKMIENLSSEAVNNILQSALAVKQRNDDIISVLCMIDLYSKENTKYTLNLIDVIYQSKILNNIVSILKLLFEKFKKQFIEPLKSFAIKFIMSKLPDSWKKLYYKVIKPIWTRIKAAIDKTKMWFKDIIDAFKAALILMWRGLKYVFSAVKDFIVKTFQIAFNAFKSAIGFVVNMLKAAIKAAFKFIVFIVKGAFKLIVYIIGMVAKGIIALAKYAWKKIMQSSFIASLKKIWSIISRPFKNIGTKIANAFRKAKSAFKNIKNKIIVKIKNIAGRIKTKVSKVLTSIKKFFAKVKTSIKTGVKNVGKFIGRQINKAFSKIPGAQYIKKWFKKIFKMIGKKLLKKKAEDMVNQSLMRKITKSIGKFIAKTAMKGPGALLNLFFLAWTIYDMFKMYKYVKTMFKPLAKEAGYDVNTPAWFEKYIFKKIQECLFSGDFWAELKNAVKAVMRSIYVELKYNLYTVEKRQDMLKERMRLYDQYSKEFYKKYVSEHIDTTNPEEVNAFIERQHELYKQIVYAAVQFKNYNQNIYEAQNADEMNADEIKKIDKQINQFNQFIKDYEKRYGKSADVLRDQVDKLETRKEAISHNSNQIIDLLERKLMAHTKFVEIASKAGFYQIFGQEFQNYVHATYPEQYDYFILKIYNEAYSGLRYLDLFRQKKKINESIMEYVNDEHEYHSQHEFNLDKLEVAMKEVVDEYASFTKNAEDVKLWLTNCSLLQGEPLTKLKDYLRYQFKIEDENGEIPDEFSSYQISNNLFKIVDVNK